MVLDFSEQMSEFVKILSEGRRFCIVAHTSPDGDAVGSCVAMKEFLRWQGKEATVVFPDRFPDFLGFLDPDRDLLLYDKEKETADGAIARADVLICQDFNSFSRASGMEEALRRSGALKILIDHHIAPDTAAFDLVFSCQDVSSTCELLYYILKSHPGTAGDPSRLPALAATALFAGMTTDTNNFSNSTYPSTFSMASDLLAAGVDRASLLEDLYNRFSEGRLRLIGELLRDGLKIVDGRFSYMLLPKSLQRKYGYSKGDVEGVVNRPLEIEDILISALFTEDDGFVRVSIRSKRDVDVNTFAKEYFNGGGHFNASGGRLPMDIRDVPAYFEKAVADYAAKAHLL